ncbi:hypothetical protein PYCC9005_003656 [Savitreella phatthalungensis]
MSAEDAMMVSRKRASEGQAADAQLDKPVKKLSKIQQLAAQRAANRKQQAAAAGEATSSIAAAPAPATATTLSSGVASGSPAADGSDVAVRGPGSGASPAIHIATQTMEAMHISEDNSASTIKHADSEEHDVTMSEEKHLPAAEGKLADIDIHETLSQPSAFALTVGSTSRSSSASQTDLLFAVTGKPKDSSLDISFSKPSPDDVVLQAQSKSKAMAAKQQQAKQQQQQAAGEGDATTAVPVTKAIVKNKPRQGRPTGTIQDKELSLVVVGHVDAGKSTLFGRLLYDIGQIDERSMSKLKKESESINKASFAFAWAMDSSEEERSRGVTIDYAQSVFVSGDTTFTILDAPGHKDFVPNMIAGATQADMAVLVIDASRGSFEAGFENGGQTKEHAILIRALGIQKVVIAINKLDSMDWSRERYIDIETQLSVFLKAVGFESKSLTYVPCSGLTGENVIRPASDALKQWYKGPSLLDAMKATESADKDVSKPFRLQIADVYPAPNSSAITVTGRISSGEVQQGDQVLCMPSKETATVKTLSAGERRDVAYAGDNVLLTLSDIDAMYLRSGDVLCHREDAIENAQMMTARIVTFGILQPLLVGSSVILHRGRVDVPAIIKSISTPSKSPSSGDQQLKRARHLLRNSQAVIQLQLKTGTIPIEPFSHNKDMGRVILRREGSTVAAGVVTQIEHPTTTEDSVK